MLTFLSSIRMFWRPLKLLKSAADLSSHTKSSQETSPQTETKMSQTDKKTLFVFYTRESLFKTIAEKKSHSRHVIPLHFRAEIPGLLKDQMS